MRDYPRFHHPYHAVSSITRGGYSEFISCLYYSHNRSSLQGDYCQSIANAWETCPGSLVLGPESFQNCGHKVKTAFDNGGEKTMGSFECLPCSWISRRTAVCGAEHQVSTAHGDGFEPCALTYSLACGLRMMGKRDVIPRRLLGSCVPQIKQFRVDAGGRPQAAPTHITGPICRPENRKNRPGPAVRGGIIPY